MLRKPASLDDLLLLDQAERLRVLAWAYLNGLPHNEARNHLRDLLRHIPRPNTKEEYLEKTHALAMTLAELTANQVDRFQPSQGLLMAARDFTTSYNGFGKASRIVPEFALT